MPVWWYGFTAYRRRPPRRKLHSTIIGRTFSTRSRTDPTSQTVSNCHIAHPGLQCLPSWVLRGEAGVQSVLHMIVEWRVSSTFHGVHENNDLQKRPAWKCACACVSSWIIGDSIGIPSQDVDRICEHVRSPRLDRAKPFTSASQCTPCQEPTTQRVAASSDALPTRRSDQDEFSSLNLFLRSGPFLIACAYCRRRSPMTLD